MATTLRRDALKRLLAWGLPIAIVLGGLLWYVGANYEWSEEEVRSGYKGEARKNQFLAMQRLLAQLGFEVEQVNDIRRLLELPPHATLFLPTAHALDEGQLQRLAQWVERGGHLILPTESRYVSERFGIESTGWWNRDKKEKHLSVQLHGKTLSLDLMYTQVLTTRHPLVTQVLVRGGHVTWAHTNEGEDKDEDDDDHEEVSSEETDDAPQPQAAPASRNACAAPIAVAVRCTPAFLLHFKLGQGRVTAVGNDSPFRNYLIGKDDAAEFVTRAFLLPGYRGPVFIAVSPQFPDLFTWLGERAWPLLLTLLAALVFWLWRVLPRFGPLIPVPPPVRPGLREHLAAVGEFHLKRRDYGALLEPLREDCRRALKWRAAREAFNGSPTALAQRLSGLGAADIDAALSAAVSDRLHFLRTAQTLTCLRDALSLSATPDAQARPTKNVTSTGES